MRHRYQPCRAVLTLESEPVNLPRSLSTVKVWPKVADSANLVASAFQFNKRGFPTKTPATSGHRSITNLPRTPIESGQNGFNELG